MRLRSVARVAPAFAVLALVAACGSGPDTLHITNESLGVTGGHGTVGDLTITRAYIPMPATPSLAAAYFTVTNAGPTADRLESVRASDFRSATLHRYQATASGADRMILVPDGAVVPAHGRLTLTPGSYHLMLRKPAERVRLGQVEHLELRFAHAGAVTLTVPVVGVTGLPGSDAGIDQMIFIQQSGMNRHEHICEAMELFASEVMPALKEGEDERLRRKEEELAPFIEKALARKSNTT